MLSRFSLIGSEGCAYFSPISYGGLTDLLIRIPKRPNSKIIDVGCGNGEALLNAMDEFKEGSPTGIGVDHSPEMIERARHFSVEYETEIALYCEDAREVFEREGPYDLILCLGASQALGGYRGTLKAAKRHLKPGGFALIGEGYWKQKPAQAYLDFLGAQEDEMMPLSQTEAAGLDHDLIPVASRTSTSEEWEEFENAYSINIERYCLESPDDPDVPGFKERIRKWREMYRDHGRDTLGFGLFLFLNEG